MSKQSEGDSPGGMEPGLASREAVGSAAQSNAESCEQMREAKLKEIGTTITEGAGPFCRSIEACTFGSAPPVRACALTLFLPPPRASSCRSPPLLAQYYQCLESRGRCFTAARFWATRATTS